MSFLVRADERIGIRCLSQAHDHAFFFIYPIIDQVHAVFTLNSEIFLVGCSNVTCPDFTSAQLVEIKV
jgi:hypothetical protein